MNPRQARSTTTTTSSQTRVYRKTGLELKPADAMALLPATIQEITKVGISAPKLSERLAAIQSLVWC
jgi:hypothetical protein